MRDNGVRSPFVTDLSRYLKQFVVITPREDARHCVTGPRKIYIINEYPMLKKLGHVKVQKVNTSIILSEDTTRFLIIETLLSFKWSFIISKDIFKYILDLL